MKKIVLILSVFFVSINLMKANNNHNIGVISSKLTYEQKVIKNNYNFYNLKLKSFIDESNIKYQLPKYNPILDLGLNLATCHGNSLFGSCVASCPGACSCNSGLFSCTCHCEGAGAPKMVSIDKEQYKNYEKLVEILNIHPDKKTDVVFKELLTMINSLEKQDYEKFNLTAVILEKDLTKLNDIQKRNLNDFFIKLGISYRI